MDKVVIISKSLEKSEIHHQLQIQKHKIRVSSGTWHHTCLFPQSSAAFMIIPVNDVLEKWPPEPPYRIDSELLANLERFSALHHKCYVLLCAPMYLSNEQTALMVLQQNYIVSSLRFLPVHNSTECIETMLTITKVTSKPLSSTVRERLLKLHEQLISEEVIRNVVEQLGIGMHESLVLMDGCGTLSCISRAPLSVMLDCSLDSATSEHLQNFFHQTSNTTL
ncbi:hypothetical protein EMCRGX_G018096 [Ephydatia muelleri]